MPDTSIATAALPTQFSSTGGYGGASYGGGSNAYGSIPAPTYPTSTAPAATAGAMAAGTGVYSQLPGYAGSLANVGANIGSETAGQLPADVIRQMQQQAAERGVSTGTTGSDNNNAAYLQALGLTSLNLTNMGQQNLQSILPQLPGYGISQNPNFYVTSAEQLGAGQSNAMLAAAPNPAAAARAAMNAVQGGLNAGINSVPTPSGGAPMTTPYGFSGSAAPQPFAAGSGIDTGWNQSLNTAAMSQSDVDKILAQYNPLGTNKSTPWDQTGAYGQIQGTSTGDYDPYAQLSDAISTNNLSQAAQSGSDFYGADMGVPY